MKCVCMWNSTRMQGLRVIRDCVCQVRVRGEKGLYGKVAQLQALVSAALLVVLRELLYKTLEMYNVQ